MYTTACFIHVIGKKVHTNIQQFTNYPYFLLLYAHDHGSSHDVNVIIFKVLPTELHATLMPT
jgi:hypothetical protein